MAIFEKPLKKVVPTKNDFLKVVEIANFDYFLLKSGTPHFWGSFLTLK